MWWNIGFRELVRFVGIQASVSWENSLVPINCEIVNSREKQNEEPAYFLNIWRASKSQSINLLFPPNFRAEKKRNAIVVLFFRSNLNESVFYDE